MERAYYKHQHVFHVPKKEAEGRVLLVFLLTLALMFVEIASGYIFGSVALLADGIHMGTHALAFGIFFLYIAQILLIKKYNNVNIYCRMEHLSEDILEEWAELLKALAHPIRLRILATLIEGSQCVKNLTELLKISQPNVSQHLRILRNKGIVGCKRDGSVVCYYIKDERALKIYEILSKEVTRWQETSSH